MSADITLNKDSKVPVEISFPMGDLTDLVLTIQAAPGTYFTWARKRFTFLQIIEGRIAGELDISNGPLTEH